jgi:hypothetical protein
MDSSLKKLRTRTGGSSSKASTAQHSFLLAKSWLIFGTPLPKLHSQLLRLCPIKSYMGTQFQVLMMSLPLSVVLMNTKPTHSNTNCIIWKFSKDHMLATNSNSKS